MSARSGEDFDVGFGDLALDEPTDEPGAAPRKRGRPRKDPDKAMMPLPPDMTFKPAWATSPGLLPKRPPGRP